MKQNVILSEVEGSLNIITMNLPAQFVVRAFEQYLRQELKVTSKTIRNYRSDLAHFSGWACLYLQARGVNVAETEQLVPHLSAGLVAQYKNYHQENKIPFSTINRRLSTLRNFGRFLTCAGLTASDPMQIIENVHKEEASGAEEKLEAVLTQFKSHLEAQNVSASTLKNYMSDTKQFLAWAALQGAAQ